MCNRSAFQDPARLQMVSKDEVTMPEEKQTTWFKDKATGEVKMYVTLSLSFTNPNLDKADPRLGRQWGAEACF